MKQFQKQMTGEAERLGLNSDEDVVAMVKELRSEGENS